MILREFVKCVMEESDRASRSKELADLAAHDQRLRKKFGEEMDSIDPATGEKRVWSQEFADDFARRHGTPQGDILDSARTMDDFVRIFGTLDFGDFSEGDWDNFNLLALHERRPQHRALRREALRQLRANGREWKSLATDMARSEGLLPELEGTKLSYPDDTEPGGRVDGALKKKGLSWEGLARKLGSGS